MGIDIINYLVTVISTVCQYITSIGIDMIQQRDSSAKMSWARVFPLDLLRYLSHKIRLSHQQTAYFYSFGIPPAGKDQYH